MIHIITDSTNDLDLDTITKHHIEEIGRASCRERV